ncbi:TraY domain-containing protein [Bradyrhizobium sp. BR 1432]|uniref:TraY domain-containing protein n=1 Tax=Bradyrhizobium sp. BR 1432 TaxID=3447966 RepID=UPI003EE697E5
MPRTVVSSGKPKKAMGKRHPLNMRTTEELRDRMEDAARRSGRSLAAEVEVRMERSLDRQDYLIEHWGQDVFDIADSMAKALWHIEQFTGQRWVDDERTFELFSLTMLELARSYRDLVLRNARERPAGAFKDKSPTELAQMFASLGGINPPRPGTGKDRSMADARADQRASREAWSKTIERLGSRPIPAARIKERKP